MTAEQLALQIVRTLHNGGHIAYFAGGCVRDQLMGRAPKDYDVATSARPEQVLALFPRSQKVGVAFGVVIVRSGRAQVEVATFRAEGTYSDGRRPDSVSFTTPEIDARRRDFTCNGLFYDPIGKVVHDFVGGREDIARKTLRAIGEPRHRFAEDHLRLIRAVRFAARLEFQIDPATFAAIRELAPRIAGISRERVGEELRMILAHDSRARGVDLLRETGLFACIWPQETLPTGGVRDTVRRIEHLPPETSRPLGIAAILRDAWAGEFELDPALAAESLRRAFMLSNHEQDTIAWLLRNLRQLLDRSRWLRHVTKKLLADPRWPELDALHVAERAGLRDPDLDTFVATLRSEGVSPAPYVTGETLIKMGVRPGPQFKRWLDELYNRQLDMEFADREAALAAARRLVGGA